MPQTTVDIEQFRDLEQGLWRPETRDDRVWLDRVLSPDFIEFCRFGHVYDRDDIIGAAVADAEAEFPFDDFAVELLAPDVALVTYVNTVTYKSKTQRARRSSIWINRDGGWRLKFQQATTLPDD